MLLSPAPMDAEGHFPEPTVAELHHGAMAIADLTVQMGRRMEDGPKRVLLQAAGELECLAYLQTNPDDSPTKEVFLRSALTLYHNAGNNEFVLREAEASDYRAWAHPEIAAEIDEVVAAARRALEAGPSGR